MLRRPGRLRRSSRNPCPMLCPGAATICLRSSSALGRSDLAALAVKQAHAPAGSAIRSTIMDPGSLLLACGSRCGNSRRPRAVGWLAQAVLFAADGSSPRLCNRAGRRLLGLPRLLAETLGACGFGLGAIFGYVGGVALGWSKGFAYWGMPILKLIGLVPVTAWIPVTSSISFRPPFSTPACSSLRLPRASPS